MRAGDRPPNSGRRAIRLRSPSYGLGARSAAPPIIATARTVAPTASAPSTANVMPNPNSVTRIGTVSVPRVSAVTWPVIITPPNRPRYASGTARWKIVVPVTSVTRLPIDRTVIAMNAASSGVREAQHAASRRRTPSAPSRSGRPSRGRRTSAPASERADRAADADRAVEVAGCRVAAVEHVGRDDDDEDPDAAEHEPGDRGDQRDPAYRAELDAGGSEVVEPALVVAFGASASSSAFGTTGARLRRRQRPQDHGDEQERDRVEDEGEADVAADEQQAGDPGPDDPGEVV